MCLHPVPKLHRGFSFNNNPLVQRQKAALQTPLFHTKLERGHAATLLQAHTSLLLLLYQTQTTRIQPVAAQDAWQ
jgi:hypothetical protein